MKKGLLRARIIWLSAALIMIGCISMPLNSYAASKKPGQVKKVSVKSDSCKAVTVSWRKVKGAKGYQIYRAVNRKGTYRKVKTTKNTTYTDKYLNAGKRYYYRVRAYAGNRKGKYSGIKGIVVKSHSWKKAAAKGHYETKNIQVPFSHASAPWNQTYNDYVCLCNVCQTYNMRYGLREDDLMEHMNEVNSPGWMEEVYKDGVLCSCGEDITYADRDAHYVDCKGSYTVIPVKRNTIEHRATIKKVWVRDSGAYTYCTRCGTCK